ncbi:hypothetical protein ACFW6F_35110 [Streptomyces sp. NPDC058746]
MALERVEFACGRCGYEWSIDYDVQQYSDEEGGVWEYFSRDGIPVASPYTPAGASACPLCRRRWIGRLLARRLIPAAPGAADTPRAKVADTIGHRPERRGAPLLGSTAHTQPEQHGRPEQLRERASGGTSG